MRHLILFLLAAGCDSATSSPLETCQALDRASRACLSEMGSATEEMDCEAWVASATGSAAEVLVWECMIEVYQQTDCSSTDLQTLSETIADRCEPASDTGG